MFVWINKLLWRFISSFHFNLLLSFLVLFVNVWVILSHWIEVCGVLNGVITQHFKLWIDVWIGQWLYWIAWPLFLIWPCSIYLLPCFSHFLKWRFKWNALLFWTYILTIWGLTWIKIMGCCSNCPWLRFEWLIFMRHRKLIQDLKIICCCWLPSCSSSLTEWRVQGWTCLPQVII